MNTQVPVQQEPNQQMTQHATSLSIRLIGVNSGYGVPPQSSEGSAQAARALRQADVEAGIRRNQVDCHWEDPVALAPHPQIDRLEALRQLCTQLEERINTIYHSSSAQQRVLPIILSGDHAVAEGAWRGVARAIGTRPGLLWIDAHLDAHTDTSTPSGNPHGMPLAALLGCQPNPWHATTAAIDAQRTCVFGARSYESAELQLLQAQGVRVFDMAEIRRLGLHAAFTTALALVRGNGHQPFGISLDLDALDPCAAHGVNTPVADGLEVEALINALHSLAHCPQLAGFEMSEYNPRTDHDQQTLQIVARLLEALSAPQDAAFPMNEAQ